VAVIFVGNDWASDHHDVEVADESGVVLARERFPQSVAGIAALHALLAQFAGEPCAVALGIETETGSWVSALVAAGYLVYAVNPLSVARYRERHVTSGAKSDRLDAHVLCELVRLDRAHHRMIAADSDDAEAIRVLARSHQALVWQRTRLGQQLRSQLRCYYPAALEAFPGALCDRDALAVLAVAPTPAKGASITLPELIAALRAGGRKRNLERRAREIQGALATTQLSVKPAVADAYTIAAIATLSLLSETTRQTHALESSLEEIYRKHPDADILDSLPGLGLILGARVLGEFGDAPNRYKDGRSRRNAAGTSPVTRQSGKRIGVSARYATNNHLIDALFRFAFTSLEASPGARAYYDQLRARGKTHNQALRQLANRLVGIIHGCLHHRRTYDETIAWGHLTETHP
jgi:transposase